MAKPKPISNDPLSKSQGTTAPSHPNPEQLSAAKTEVAKTVLAFRDRRAKAKKESKRGRKAAMTLAVVEEIGAKIAKGLPEEYACLLLGVSYDAFKKAQQRKPEFVLAIKRAQAVFLDGALDCIGAGITGWQGQAWILERRHKEHFSKTDIHFTQHNSIGITFDETMQKELSELARKQFVGSRN